MELNVIIYCPSYSIPYMIVVEKYDLFCPEMSNILPSVRYRSNGDEKR